MVAPEPLIMTQPKEEQEQNWIHTPIGLSQEKGDNALIDQLLSPTEREGGCGGNASCEKSGKAESDFWQSLNSHKGKTKTDGKKYYEWDYTHGDVEVYDKNRNHQGSANPQTGELYKPPVRGRKLSK